MGSGWGNIRPTPLGVFSRSPSISGSFDNPYNFPSLKADFIPMQAPVSTGPWRSVMYPARVFARESFVDEMAVTAGIDPLDFHRLLLAPGDLLKVGSPKIDSRTPNQGPATCGRKIELEDPPCRVPLTASGDVVSPATFVTRIAS